MKFNKVALSIACAAGFTVAGAAAANADTVTVKSGDTLSQIADENNTTVSSIQSLNSLQNIHLIFETPQHPSMPVSKQNFPDHTYMDCFPASQ